SATSAKTHYVIADAIGVTKSLKTASQPLITKPNVSLKDLAMGVMMGVRDEDIVSSLAGRLARLDKQLNSEEHSRIREKAGGVELRSIVASLLESIDPDRVESKARELEFIPEDIEPSDESLNKAQDHLVGEAASVFSGEFIDLIDGIRRTKEQTIDHEGLDTLVRAGWEGDATENAQRIAQEFKEYLNANRDNIEALSIFYGQPHRRSKLTYEMITEVLDNLKRDRPSLAPLTVWNAFAHLDEYKGANPASQLTALVALIRRVCGLDETLTRHSDRVRRNFQSWIMNRHAGAGEKFSEEQMVWLHMIRDHLETSFHIETSDLEMAPFNSKGGMAKMHVLFGDKMDDLLSEINETLAA
ncbi:MAG: restriction endonuclease subunit R, partial [Gammaproteobacteria bacterium]|nr:restriction endonuclease subunit R [Gammaproteobacteria bacterium]